MSNGPWPASKDKGGYTLVTVAGIEYKVQGTGHSYNQLVRSVRNGLATIVSEGDGGKGEK